MSIGTDQSSHSAWHRGASLGAARYVHLAASRSSAGRVAPSPNIADADTSLSLHCGASEWDASSCAIGMIHDIQTRSYVAVVQTYLSHRRVDRGHQSIDGQTIAWAGVDRALLLLAFHFMAHAPSLLHLHVCGIHTCKTQHCTNLLLIHYICKLARRPNRP